MAKCDVCVSIGTQMDYEVIHSQIEVQIGPLPAVVAFASEDGTPIRLCRRGVI